MEITLSKPELARFVDEQVKAGHFSSPTDVVEAALAAIEEGNAEIERGEGIDFDRFAAEMRRKYAGK